MCGYLFFFSSRRRHTRCALVTGVQTCALPISLFQRIDVPITREKNYTIRLLACERQRLGPERGIIERNGFWKAQFLHVAAVPFDLLPREQCFQGRKFSPDFILRCRGPANGHDRAAPGRQAKSDTATGKIIARSEEQP